MYELLEFLKALFQAIGIVFSSAFVLLYLYLRNSSLDELKSIVRYNARIIEELDDPSEEEE